MLLTIERVRGKFTTFEPASTAQGIEIPQGIPQAVGLWSSRLFYEDLSATNSLIREQAAWVTVYRMRARIYIPCRFQDLDYYAVFNPNCCLQTYITTELVWMTSVDASSMYNPWTSDT